MIIRSQNKGDIVPSGISAGMPMTYFSIPERKSEINFFDIKMESAHSFNWLQRKMWKIFFGAEIKNKK